MRAITLCLVLATLLSCLFVVETFGEIENSHHDFSGAAWSNGEVCLVCHTPHNANTDVPGSPLWNHQLSSAVYQLYQSATIDAAVGQPLGNTKLCLSCHDGTVAIENHSGITSGTRFATFGNVGTDLGDDHPVSIVYNSSLATADRHLHDPSLTPSGLGGTIDEDLLDNGRLGCPSCHDPHISRNTQGCVGCHNVHGGGTQTLSLRVSNNGSTLCLTCHDK